MSDEERSTSDHEEVEQRDPEEVLKELEDSIREAFRTYDRHGKGEISVEHAKDVFRMIGVEMD